MDYPSSFPEGCDNPPHNTNFTLLAFLAYNWQYSPSEIRTFTYGIPIALVIGVVGNGAFLFVCAKIKSLHNVTNLYLVNLAFADIFFIISSTGMYLYSFIKSPVRHSVQYQSSLGCVLSFGSSNVMYYASLGLVTLVGIERYYCICYPLKHRVVASKSRTIKLIAVTWLCSILLSSVRILKYSRLVRYCTIWPRLPDFKGWPQKSNFCYLNDPNLIIVSDLADAIPFFLSLLWNIFVYGRII